MPLPKHSQAKQNKANRRPEEADNLLMTDTMLAINKAWYHTGKPLKEPEIYKAQPGISNPQRKPPMQLMI